MTSLCLEQLLTNKKSCSLVIINDTIKLSALPILTDVGKQALEENKNLIVVLTETSPSFWKQQFHNDKVKDMFIIDAFSNPRGWDDSVTEKDSNVLQVNDIDNMEELILKPIMKKVMNTAANCTIVMDSITPLALISQRRTYQLLKALESLTTGKSILWYKKLIFIKDKKSRFYSFNGWISFRYKINFKYWIKYARFT